MKRFPLAVAASLVMVVPCFAQLRNASADARASQALASAATACTCGPNCPCCSACPGKQPTTPAAASVVQTHPFFWNVGDMVNRPTGPAAVQFYADSETTVKEKKNKTVVKTRATSSAFENVNRQRMSRGLRPFVFSEGLTRAAEKVAAIKAANCLSGHLSGPMSDFAMLEPGVQCAATGADGSKISANDPNWYTCCMDEPYVYAGAGSAIGPDGNKYMSLFVANQQPETIAVAAVENYPPVQAVPVQQYYFAPQQFSSGGGTCSSGNCGGGKGRGRR